MLPDITIKGYYLQFVHNAKTDIVKYKENLDTTIKVKEEVYKYLEDNKNILKDYFDINLDDIEIEWRNKEYNSKEYLYNLTIVLLRNTVEHPNRIVLLQLAKYCNVLRNEHKYNNCPKNCVSNRIKWTIFYFCQKWFKFVVIVFFC